MHSYDKILDFSGGTLIKVAYIGEDETEEVSVKCCNKLPLIESTCLFKACMIR